MTRPPDFDPYELLGIELDADAPTIDRAYKARIRYVHPDIAGIAGLDETKRLNIAREWLLDRDLRAQLPRPTFRWRRRGPTASPPPPPAPTASPPPASSSVPPRPPGWERTARSKPSWEYDPLDDDPLTFDFGAATARIHDFFERIRSLSADERARVTYSLGDEPPFSFEPLSHELGERLWARSRALGDATERVWRERDDEGPPLLFPRGRIFGNGASVADAYAQWLLLAEAVRQQTSDARAIAAVERKCTWAWEASIGHGRYGTFQREVEALLSDARGLSLAAVERLARAWDRDMGGFLYGRPGEDWFPAALGSPGPALVSARLAAVDASRIEPPDGLEYGRHNAFRCGLRLTAYVLALGGVDEPGRDYLRPWREALDRNPSFWDRARYGMPLG